MSDFICEAIGTILAFIIMALAVLSLIVGTPWLAYFAKWNAQKAAIYFEPAKEKSDE